MSGHNKNNTLSFAKIVSFERVEYALNCMSSLKTIPGTIPLNHVGCCIQILANLASYASIKLHFNNW